MSSSVQSFVETFKRHPNRTGLGLLLLAGVVPGLLLHPNTSLPFPVSYISQIAGWLYFSAWGLSFYPQLLTNWRNKSIEGFSPDFALVNCMGFVALSIYYCSLYWNPYVQSLYRQRHGSENSVRSNDVGAALHAAAVTAFTLWQCYHYDTALQFSALCSLFVAAVTILTAVWAVCVVTFAPSSVLALLYALSYVKLTVTISKYVPQVLLNFRRKSTEGWDMRQVFLDVGGGVLSIFQLCLEAAVLADASLISGNLVKLGLGVVSLLYDGVLVAQHLRYHKYRRVTEETNIEI